MASLGMFGLNLFAFFFILFSLVEFNFSEECNRFEKSIVLTKLEASPRPSSRHRPDRRYYFPIDGLRKPEHSKEQVILENPEDVFRIRRSPGKNKNRKGTLLPGHTRHAPPKTEDITGFPNLNHATPKGTRKRWVDRNTNEIFEWDSEKGELEKYNKRGKHLGSFDPYTGAPRGEAQSSRSIEV